MFGYNTGWKFSGWWSAAAVTSTGNNTAFTRNGISTWTPTWMSWSGSPVFTDPSMSASILTHGYNSVRLRFAVYDGNATPTTTLPVTWRVYLVETDSEEDQATNDVVITHHSTVLTSWESFGAQPVVPSATRHILGLPYSDDYVKRGYNGKPWAALANQVRLIRNDATLAGLVEHLAQDPTTNASFESYAGTMLSKAQGLDVYAGPSTITTSGTPDTTAITSSSIQAHAYSPVFGVANTGHAGELYITNLAGAARILVVPSRYWGYTASVTKNLAPSVGAAGNARDVGFIYNLIQ